MRKTKHLNLHSTVFRHASLRTLSLSLSLSSAPVSLSVPCYIPRPSTLYLSSSVAGKLLCPFAFPKAARNSRSQFSISADFSIRLRGAASRRAYARGFFTARVSHHRHPLEKREREREREREGRRKEEGGKNAREERKKKRSCPFSRTERHSASRTPSRIEERRDPLPAPTEPTEPLQTEIRLSLGGIGSLQPTSAHFARRAKEISAIGMPFSFVETSPRINKASRLSPRSPFAGGRRVARVNRYFWTAVTTTVPSR